MSAGPALLRARGVRRRYGRRRVLCGIDLDTRPGEVIGICGENGTGKTTLVRILAGLLRPDAGAIDRPPALGYVPQAPLLYDQLTPWEHFRYFAAARRLPTGDWTGRALELMDLYNFRDSRDQRAATLSEGTRRKLNLTIALLADPPLLILDEPYDGLEWSTYLRFWDHLATMRDQGKAVLIISHLFYDRARLDRVLELRDGALETP